MRSLKQLKNTLGRVKARLYSKYLIPFAEKEMVFENGKERIHYLLYKKPGDALIIGFQAFNIKGARYNYVSPLSALNASRLYIKDDFVEMCGNYYLGRNGKYNIEKAVFEMIDSVIKETGAKRLFFIGSSKGGYAAVNFGIHYKNAAIIVGAPQYHLGTYMSETRKFNKGLEDIVGMPMPVSAEKVKELDERLSKKIREDKYASTQKAYIHCSINETTYDLHVKDLIADLSRSGISVSFDQGEYTEHSDLKYYFPEYLGTTLSSLIG